MKKLLKSGTVILLSLVLLLSAAGCGLAIQEQQPPAPLPGEETHRSETETPPVKEPAQAQVGEPTPEDAPPAEEYVYTGQPYCVINDNIPAFTAEDLTTNSYEYYSPLDELGRCGVTMASVGQDLMPTEKRGSIQEVKPTGWHSVQYDFVDGKSLSNRCHLIGFQLAGENANQCNLITGTRYMNTKGMLPFENMVADYVQETGEHVLYRVTPDFRGDELVARGVWMEAMSVEDQGDSILFYVYCFNVEPGVEIDYATGDSWLAEENRQTGPVSYILNTNTMKFHRPDCPSAASIRPENRQEYDGDRDTLIQWGYAPCGSCKP